MAWCATAASWTCTAPFGVPVVPLVKCSSDGVSGAGRRGLEHVVALADEAAERHQVGPASACAGRDASSTPTIRMSSRSGAGRGSLPPCVGTGADVVTSTRIGRGRAAARSARARTRRTAASTRTGRRNVPSAATYSSGTRPASVATPAPGSRPWPSQSAGEAVHPVFEHRVGDVDGMVGVEVVARRTIAARRSSPRPSRTWRRHCEVGDVAVGALGRERRVRDAIVAMGRWLMPVSPVAFGVSATSMISRVRAGSVVPPRRAPVGRGRRRRRRPRSR